MVWVVPWKTAAYIDFDSALNVVSECIMFAHECSYGSKWYDLTEVYWLKIEEWYII